MKSGSLVFLASSLDLVLRSKTAETSVVSFRPFLMSDTFENGIPKALEMVVLVTEKLVFTNHCKTALVKITFARFRGRL